MKIIESTLIEFFHIFLFKNPLTQKNQNVLVLLSRVCGKLMFKTALKLKLRKIKFKLAGNFC